MRRAKAFRSVIGLSCSHRMIIYHNSEFIEKSAVAISPDDRGFLFADGVYEVILSYRGRLFKCAEHLDRLALGLKELKITPPDVPALEAVAIRLLKDNGLENSSALLYFQVTRGVATRT